MRIEASRILLTGASGGIGAALALELAQRGARLALVGRDLRSLQTLAQRLASINTELLCIAADISDSAGSTAVCEQMLEHFGGVDILINNAGVSDFSRFSESDPQQLERILNTNVLAPMRLSHAVLPAMLDRGSGQIVNVGSVFGSIAFACFTGYSASKFALRGFSEALRRELQGSGVGVTYVAPRAVNTPFNTGAVRRMAERVKMPMDEPEQVARNIVRAIEQDRKDVYPGFPEALFVRINALWPRLVDKALSRQNEIMREYTREA